MSTALMSQRARKIFYSLTADKRCRDVTCAKEPQQQLLKAVRLNLMTDRQYMEEAKEADAATIKSRKTCKS